MSNWICPYCDRDNEECYCERDDSTIDVSDLDHDDYQEIDDLESIPGYQEQSYDWD